MSKAGSVQVGFFISKNAEALFKSFGFDNLSPGDQEHQVNAIVAYLNQHGGLRGRKIVPVFGVWDATAGNTVAQREAACAKWTQDNHVVAILAESFPSFTGCSNRAKLPLFSLSLNIPVTAEEFATTPLMVTVDNPTDERLFPGWAAGLAQAGYFTGTPAAPRKLGVIYLDTPQQQRSFKNNLVPALKRYGVPVDSAYALSTDSVQAQVTSLQSAVLRFQTERINHVMFLDTGGQALLFSVQAESQGYRPRYGLTSYSSPAQLEANAPDGQFANSVGVGWNNSVDVNAANRPIDTSGGKKCTAIMTKAGVDMSAAGTRSSAFTYCDGALTLAAAANRAPSLGATDILQGLRLLGPAQHSVGNSFMTDLRSHRDGVAEVRSFAYNTGCQCFRYVSGARRHI